MDKEQMLADILEGALSGQYGRDTAELIARECLQALECKDPVKWQIGIYIPNKNYINWEWGGFIYADTEKQALELKSDVAKWALESFGERHILHARPYPS